jgi:hypothetical protein
MGIFMDIYRVVHLKVARTRAVCSYCERYFTKLAHAHTGIVALILLLSS